MVPGRLLGWSKPKVGRFFEAFKRMSDWRPKSLAHSTPSMAVLPSLLFRLTAPADAHVGKAGAKRFGGVEEVAAIDE